MRHRFGAEAEIRLGVVTGRLQGLRVDFPEDFLFGEVLRADRQADLFVGRIRGDRRRFAGRFFAAFRFGRFRLGGGFGFGAFG
jgi:hypothetical protein